MGSKNQEYKELFEKIDQEEDGEVYLRCLYISFSNGFRGAGGGTAWHHVKGIVSRD
jgi:hypothetical protein